MNRWEVVRSGPRAVYHRLVLDGGRYCTATRRPGGRWAWTVRGPDYVGEGDQRHREILAAGVEPTWRAARRAARRAAE